VEPARRPSRVRLWLAVGLGGALLAVLVGAVVVVFTVGRFVNRIGNTADGGARVHDACITLETRLNRLTPPGATSGPAARATAIRDENAAVQLFLAEIEQMRDDRRVGMDGDRGDRLGRWRALLAARTVYAEALDRQVRAGGPAFFVAPRTRHGGSVIERLDRIAPASCQGPIRRLAAPDL
jgi:hypothetical protein